MQLVHISRNAYLEASKMGWQDREEGKTKEKRKLVKNTKIKMSKKVRDFNESRILRQAPFLYLVSLSGKVRL